ncbi:MAG: hypothetical protein AMXMBFR16_11560 [Candidatus Uhrbacteria bacterium]
MYIIVVCFTDGRVSTQTYGSYDAACDYFDAVQRDKPLWAEFLYAASHTEGTVLKGYFKEGD